MSNEPLFRSAVVESRQVSWLGHIILIRPISFSLLTSAAAVITTVILAGAYLGSYTKRTTVRGQLVPDIGVVNIYSPQSGIVLKRNVKEGQLVDRGELLFLLTSERKSSNAGDIQQAVSQQVTLREQSLRHELSYTKKLHQEQEALLRSKLSALNAELDNIEGQIQSQRSRIEIASSAFDRTSRLFAKGYISEEIRQQKHADLLDQESRLQALERERISIKREIAVKQNELQSSPLHNHNQILQIERMLTTATQEWTESESKRDVAITAPQRGIATTINVDVGHSINGNRPLLSIVPEKSTLQAHLYAPSRAIGFIKTGDQVLLRYHAFPYQKFGHAQGRVLSVSRAAILSEEIPLDPGTREPLYRIIVTLDKQTILAYGQTQPLQSGMLAEADILHEKRRIYEWALEPLFTVTGKM